MNHISAAENHTIQLTDRRWRLLSDEKPTAEATPQGLRYGGDFSQTRRLPRTGYLERGMIKQVVLGWQKKDEAWHLGLILAPSLAAERGSRWCELVYWPDPDVEVFHDIAEDTARHLAQVLGVPYNGIPPQPTQRAHPPRPLPEPPFRFGVWSLDVTATGKARLVLERSSRWRWRKVGRMAWYTFWAAIYLVLSLATLNSEIALPNAGTLLPNPQLLPYLGIGVFVMLVGMIIHQFLQIARQPERIIVDGNEQTVSAYKGDALRWQIPASEIHSVYASEIIKRNAAPPETEFGELNLHLGNGNFQHVALQDKPHDDSTVAAPDEELLNREDEIITEITPATVHTDLQAAALTIATTLGDIPAWHDQRVK